MKKPAKTFDRRAVFSNLEKMAQLTEEAKNGVIMTTDLLTT